MYQELSGLVNNLFARGEERGEERGALKKAHSVALNLRRSNTPFDMIVSVVEVNPEIVRGWFQEEDAKSGGKNAE